MKKANRRGFFGMLAAAGTATAAGVGKPEPKELVTPITARIYLDGKELTKAVCDELARHGTEVPFADITTHSSGPSMKRFAQK